MNHSPSKLQAQINKRLTLNLLIQGAAAHAYTTAHHLVATDLNELDEELFKVIDQLAIHYQMNYCIGEMLLLFGRPNRFWGLSWWPQKPFKRHPLMSKYGNRLASEEARHIKKKAKEKQIPGIRFVRYWHMIKLHMQLAEQQEGHEQRLEEIAKLAIVRMWNINADQLDASITENVAFGNLMTPQTWTGKVLRHGVVGYGGVERRNQKFHVVAKARTLPLLIHELVKGTMELISLHALGELPDDVYQAVLAEADQFEYEAWLFQAGPAIWRKLLAIKPRHLALSQLVMRLAKMEPLDLDQFLIKVIEEPNRATDQIIRSTES